jgi:hypothetical protein
MKGSEGTSAGLAASSCGQNVCMFIEGQQVHVWVKSQNACMGKANEFTSCCPVAGWLSLYASSNEETSISTEGRQCSQHVSCHQHMCMHARDSPGKQAHGMVPLWRLTCGPHPGHRRLLARCCSAMTVNGALRS